MQNICPSSSLSSLSLLHIPKSHSHKLNKFFWFNFQSIFIHSFIHRRCCSWWPTFCLCTCLHRWIVQQNQEKKINNTIAFNNTKGKKKERDLSKFTTHSIQMMMIMIIFTIEYSFKQIYTHFVCKCEWSLPYNIQTHT